jgi:hypothetical protein
MVGTPPFVPWYNRNLASLHVQKECNAFLEYMGSDYENYYDCIFVTGIDFRAGGETNRM